MKERMIRYSEEASQSFMNCPHCQSRNSQKLDRSTGLGYAMFRCDRCQRQYNERLRCEVLGGAIEGATKS